MKKKISPATESKIIHQESNKKKGSPTEKNTARESRVTGKNKNRQRRG